MATGLRVWARVLLLVIAWTACSSFILWKTAAQGIGVAVGGEAPIEVLAEQGIEWQQDSKRFTARGNAHLSRGNMVVQADVLMAYYRTQSQGAVEIYRVQAIGHVRITSPTQAASGDTADYIVDDDRLLRLIGHPARLETSTETLTARDVIEYHEARRHLIARGDVHVTTREGRTLRGDAVTADFLPCRLRKEEQQQEKMARLTASGNVQIETAEEVIRGKHGTYDATTGLATLTGSVKITRGNNQLNGGHAIINLKTGWGRLYAVAPGLERRSKMGVEGRVRLLLVPGK